MTLYCRAERDHIGTIDIFVNKTDTTVEFPHSSLRISQKKKRKLSEK